MRFETRRQLRQRIREIAQPVVELHGCTLVAVELTGDRGGPILRLYIDRPGGVGVDECARVARAVSPELDVYDPIDGAYSLEVSSPGIERPVELPADFVAFSGYRARIRLAPGTGRRRYTGVLRGMEDGKVLVEADDLLHRLEFQDIDRAHLVLEMHEYEALGRAIPSVDDAGGSPPSPAPHPQGEDR